MDGERGGRNREGKAKENRMGTKGDRVRKDRKTKEIDGEIGRWGDTVIKR